MSKQVHRFALAWLCGLLAALSLPAAAQVYRIVGPDGKVTFSDRPPPAPDAKTTRAPTTGTNTAPAAGSPNLPFELRNVAGRYPVTLYTSGECGPCASARVFLASRGIPYTERTVSTNDDAAALRRLSGEVRVPFLTIGSQQLHGYSETEWSQYLDAAGYPKTSQLPSSYRNPPPAPLVAAQPAAPRVQEAAREQAATSPATAPEATEAPANPAGIRF